MKNRVTTETSRSIESPKNEVAFLLKLPWKSFIIWALFIAALYALRHFFLIIFLTFIVSYSMRGLISYIKRGFFPRVKSRLLDSTLVVASYLTLLVALYGVGAYLVPEFVRQGESIVRRVISPTRSPRESFNILLRDSLGRYLFHEEFGPRGSDAYERAYSDAIDNSTPNNSTQSLSDEESVKAAAVKAEEGYKQFEQVERERLVAKWRRGEFAARLQGKIEEFVVSLTTDLGAHLGELIPTVVMLPFNIGLVLLLSFFITLDVPRLGVGIQKLGSSRISPLYQEIAPSIRDFGTLIGRAFQAQALIAIVNSLLTFVAIKALGIQSEIFLCVIVFICSFIPVVGVVLSSVPIALMAMTQEEGSILLAFWAIVAILVIHFVETSLLNPRILGSMLHLDPVLVLAILAVSEHFFGVWGLLLGVPVAVYIIRILILDEGIPGLIESSTT
jgi:predicted PurR-regulated permease PerM